MLLALPEIPLSVLAARWGGQVPIDAAITSIAPPEGASAGALAPVLRSSRLGEALAARQRGAALLIDASLASRLPAPSAGEACWVHAHATWAMAQVLGMCVLQLPPPVIGEGSSIGPHAVLHPGVVLGKNVKVGAHAVLGHPGFGWATGPDAQLVAVPQLGGVVIEDDVSIGPLSTVDAGTLSPTVVRRGTKIDAHVHVGHNCVIGEGCIVAAQAGFAGSVTLGRGVLVGGQAGIADHVKVGDGARIAAKSGVIGDVAAGEVVAGYPAVARMRWLRGLAWLYRNREGE
ncbi:DapH/DapD/GlmU-related protein [Pendulispora albinea]|uniref:UDP-3-O-(3-hydroxymyristoyl)glucosamine N-acyltransferase n=1 Tax=Pendulispora albinea TaxID=2741071 RepID=A0ABZ2LR45_9BACT